MRWWLFAEGVREAVVTKSTLTFKQKSFAAGRTIGRKSFSAASRSRPCRRGGYEEKLE